jgi:acetamidase/formamidase
MAVHYLARSEQGNIHYRWDRGLRPAISVEPGDEVIVETRTGEDDQLRPGDPPDAIAAVDRGRIHALTGPIFVNGAEPGDVLEVSVLSITPAEWGLTLQRPGGGLLTDFPPYLRFFQLDVERWTAEFAPGIVVPLRPFLGVMGVAPAEGVHSTIPPGSHGGNLDCKDVLAGTVLSLPVFVPGALFSCGDGHAAQGDGEVCITAIECAMTARLRFQVRKGRHLSDPQLETPDAWMTLSAAPTLEDAARRALEAMLDLIVARTGLSRADAYALASMAVDLRINQVVNQPMMGVRAVLPKTTISGPSPAP